MEKLKQRKLEIDIQLWQLQSDIIINKIKPDQAKKKLDALKEEKRTIEQSLAQADKPKDTETKTSNIEQIRNAMLEKRAITLNGTGAISQIKELAKELSRKTPILEKVKYFYGANAATNIPVLSPGLATPGVVSEGATSIGNDTQAVLGSKSITPHAYVSILPVSAEALSLGSVDLESELSSIFSDAFAQGFHSQVLIGDGTGLNFKGLFTGIPTTNLVSCAASGSPKVADLVKLSLQIRDFIDDGKIIMNPTIYASILADNTTGVAEIYKEELIRNKTIEGVEVILTGIAPNSVSAGSVIAVAGRLTDYGIGLASEIQIEPIKKVGDTNTYFQAIIFSNGTKIVDKNFYGLVAS